jgi:hypothetical protein
LSSGSGRVSPDRDDCLGVVNWLKKDLKEEEAAVVRLEDSMVSFSTMALLAAS